MAGLRALDESQAIPARRGVAHPPVPAPTDARPHDPEPGATGAHVAVERGGHWSVLALAAVAAVLAFGWSIRDQDYYYPDQGLGYTLGIVGGSMMLLLLLYPLRKKLRFMRAWGAVRHWFRIHMVFGILGPVLILFHCSFHLGSVNSNVALFSMLVVAGSGLIGRYAYRKIHYGLYGGRATLAELQRLRGVTDGEIHAAFAFAPAVEARLAAFERRLSTPARNPLAGAFRLLMLGWSARSTRGRALRDLRRSMRAQARAEGWDRRIARARWRNYRDIIVKHVAAARQVAEFGAYERVFSLWHVLHIPLFFMLVIAGIAHVVAVHAY